MPPRKYKKGADPNAKLPKIDPEIPFFRQKKPSPSQISEKNQQIRERQAERRQEWSAKQDQLIKRGQSRRGHELNEAYNLLDEKNALKNAKNAQNSDIRTLFGKSAQNSAENLSNLPADLQDPNLYINPLSSDPILSGLGIHNPQRKRMIEKYTADLEGKTGWDKMTEENRRNVEDRLNQMKKIQFMAETGIALNEVDSEDDIAIKIWDKRNKERAQAAVADDYFRQLREGMREKRKNEQKEKLIKHTAALKNPDNMNYIRETMRDYKNKKFQIYKKKKDDFRDSQDDFINRFRHKQHLREALLLQDDFNGDDEAYNRLIQHDEAAYQKFLDDKAMLAAQGRDIHEEILQPPSFEKIAKIEKIAKTEKIEKNQNLDKNDQNLNDKNNNIDLDLSEKTKKSDMSLQQLNHRINFKKKVSLEDVQNVYDRIEKKIGQNSLQKNDSEIEREKMLSNLRQELGLKKLPKDSENELKDVALKRLDIGLRERKKKLASKFDQLRKTELNIRRKLDGSEDPTKSSKKPKKTPRDFFEGNSDQNIGNDNEDGEDGGDDDDDDDTALNKRAGLQKRRKQIYAPVIIPPPEDLNLDALNKVLDTETFKYEFEDRLDDKDHLGNKVDTDELSVLRKHLGMKRLDRSPNEQKRANKLKKRKKRQIYSHLRSKLREPVRTDQNQLIKNPITGEIVPRHSLPYISRVRADIAAEFEAKHAHLDSMTADEKDEYFRAQYRSQADMPRILRHELKTSQYLGPPLIPQTDDHGHQKLEELLFGLHSEAALIVGDTLKELPTSKRRDIDPSDWEDKVKPEIALIAPEFNKHVDPVTKQRGIHVLSHDSKVYVPKPADGIKSELRLRDGMHLKVPVDLFNREFDENLDKTRNTHSILNHLRPKHENEWGYLLDQDGNDISHLNKSVDVNDKSNQDKFIDTYGETPMKYVNKMYHEILGDTLMQKSREFMHNTNSNIYKRPFDNIIKQFSQNSDDNDDNNELVYDEFGNAVPNLKTKVINYNYNYDDKNVSFTNSAQNSAHFLRSKKGASNLENDRNDNENSKPSSLLSSLKMTPRGIINTAIDALKYTMVDSNLIDYRIDDDDDHHHPSNNGGNSRNKSKNKKITPFEHTDDNIFTPRPLSTIFKHRPNNWNDKIDGAWVDLVDKGKKRGYYTYDEIIKISSYFYRPSEAPENLIRLAEEHIKDTTNNSINTKIDKSFSDFLPTLLQNHYSNHDYYTNNIQKVKNKIIEDQINKYRHDGKYLIKKMFKPIEIGIENIYQKGVNFFDQTITKPFFVSNKNNITIPDYPMGDYTRTPYKEIPISLQSHLNGDGGVGQQYENSKQFGGLYKQFNYDDIKNGDDNNSNLFNLSPYHKNNHNNHDNNNNNTPESSYLNKKLSLMNPNLFPSRHQSQLLYEMNHHNDGTDNNVNSNLDKNLNQETSIPLADNFETALSKFNTSIPLHSTLQQQPQHQQQHQKQLQKQHQKQQYFDHNLEMKKLNSIFKTLDSLSPPQIKDKQSRLQWLNSQMNSLSLRDHLNTYLQTRGGQFANIFRPSVSVRNLPSQTNNNVDNVDNVDNNAEKNKENSSSLFSTIPNELIQSSLSIPLQPSIIQKQLKTKLSDLDQFNQHLERNMVGKNDNQIKNNFNNFQNNDMNNNTTTPKSSDIIKLTNREQLRGLLEPPSFLKGINDQNNQNDNFEKNDNFFGYKNPFFSNINKVNSLITSVFDRFSDNDNDDNDNGYKINRIGQVDPLRGKDVIRNDNLYYHNQVRQNNNQNDQNNQNNYYYYLNNNPKKITTNDYYANTRKRIENNHRNEQELLQQQFQLKQPKKYSSTVAASKNQ